MPSIGEIKAALYGAASALETEAAAISAASQEIHAERNVLVITLDQTSRTDLQDAMQEMRTIQDDLESHSEKLIGIVSTLRAAANRM
jgi:hypothetical protein